MKKLLPFDIFRSPQVATVAAIWSVTLIVALIGQSESLAQVDSPKPDDYADSLAGGPDYWQVTLRGKSSILNMRAGPARNEAVVRRLSNGTKLRNLGCRMSGGVRWCQVAQVPPKTARGWVAGRFLRETAPPATVSSQDSAYSRELPCSITLGKPAQQCGYRVERGSEGYASVWIALPSGGERFIEFRAGKPAQTNLDLEMVFERWGDVFLIRLGDAELYEIPYAIIFES